MCSTDSHGLLCMMGKHTEFVDYFSLLFETKYLASKVKEAKVYSANNLWKYQSIISWLQNRVVWQRGNCSWWLKTAKATRAKRGSKPLFLPFIVCRLLALQRCSAHTSHLSSRQWTFTNCSFSRPQKGLLPMNT